MRHDEAPDATLRGSRWPRIHFLMKFQILSCAVCHVEFLFFCAAPSFSDPRYGWRVKRKITMLVTRGGPAWRSRRFGERVPSRELHLIDHVILILTSLPMLANPKPSNEDIGDKPAQLRVPEAKHRRSFQAPNHLKHHSGRQCHPTSPEAPVSS